MKMASSKTLSSAALFLSLNLIFFSMVSSTTVPLPACPIDILKLGVCANLLGLVNVEVGSPPTLPCCSLIDPLVDLEAAVCLCTAIRANILGINLDVNLVVGLLLNDCGKHWPSGFTCL